MHPNLPKMGDFFDEDMNKKSLGCCFFIVIFYLNWYIIIVIHHDFGWPSGHQNADYGWSSIYMTVKKVSSD